MGDGTSIELHVEAFGPDDGDPVLLLSGADAQCTRWTPAFVDPLVEAGHRVVRFDTRDWAASSRILRGSMVISALSLTCPSP
jgi:pimeloyl-ACP methyl ester carboxylesterase